MSGQLNVHNLQLKPKDAMSIRRHDMLIKCMWNTEITGVAQLFFVNLVFFYELLPPNTGDPDSESFIW